MIYKIGYSTIIRSSNIFFFVTKDMHKSVLFTFGLLATSLVMLVLVPFLNQQQNKSILKTGLAQEYDKYGDNYYSTYPTDDKKLNIK